MKKKKVVKPIREKKVEAIASVNLEGMDMRKVEAYIKARKFEKVAHVPNGKYLWTHFEIEEDMKQAISRYQTTSNMKIHDLCKRALKAFLKVK